LSEALMNVGDMYCRAPHGFIPGNIAELKNELGEKGTYSIKIS
jgi:hypothetical protein